jgi:hypothetical protein
MVSATQEVKRGRGRPRKQMKLVRYSVLWLEPHVAAALTEECGLEKRTSVVRRLIQEGLRARGRLTEPAGNAERTAADA